MLFERQMKNLPGRAADTFLEGLKKINFKGERIPCFKNIDHVLQLETGWQLEVVPGLIPDKAFFELLSEKKFPATCWLRSMEELDYLESPDMFHDVFAHVPILTNQYFVNFLQGLSKIALKYMESPLVVELVGRVYWFTVEFGLIEAKNGLRIFGAGILSSSSETIYCLSKSANRKKYDVKSIMEKSYYKHDFQDRYYVIKSYKQLFDSIEEIEYWVEIALNKCSTFKEDVTKLDVVLK